VNQIGLWHNQRGMPIVVHDIDSFGVRSGQVRTYLHDRH
jgi:hypothetical protein